MYIYAYLHYMTLPLMTVIMTIREGIRKGIRKGKQRQGTARTLPTP